MFDICESCGLVRNATAEAIGSGFYELEYWRQITDTRAVLGFSQKSAAAIDCVVARTFQWDQSRIVDIGCAFGETPATIATRFPDSQVWGIEPDQSLFQKLVEANAYRNLTFLCGGIEQQLPTIGKVDVVLMLFVLEHLPHPIESLRLCRKSLAENGAIVIQVPNLCEPGHFGLQYFFRAPHLFYFTPATLTMALEISGFDRVLVIEGFKTASGPQLFAIARAAESSTTPNPQSLECEASAIRSRLRQSGNLVSGPARLMWARSTKLMLSRAKKLIGLQR